MANTIESINDNGQLIRKKVYGPQCPVGRQPAKDDEEPKDVD